MSLDSMWKISKQRLNIISKWESKVDVFLSNLGQFEKENINEEEFKKNCSEWIKKEVVSSRKLPSDEEITNITKKVIKWEVDNIRIKTEKKILESLKWKNDFLEKTKDSYMFDGELFKELKQELEYIEEIPGFKWVDFNNQELGLIYSSWKNIREIMLNEPLANQEILDKLKDKWYDLLFYWLIVSKDGKVSETKNLINNGNILDNEVKVWSFPYAKIENSMLEYNNVFWKMRNQNYSAYELMNRIKYDWMIFNWDSRLKENNINTILENFIKWDISNEIIVYKKDSLNDYLSEDYKKLKPKLECLRWWEVIETIYRFMWNQVKFHDMYFYQMNEEQKKHFLSINFNVKELSEDSLKDDMTDDDVEKTIESLGLRKI